MTTINLHISYGESDVPTFNAICKVAEDLEGLSPNYMTMRQKTIQFLLQETGYLRSKLSAWVEDFLKDPQHSLEWGSDIVMCAERLKVYHTWLGIFTKASTDGFTTAVYELSTTLLAETRSSESSSSPMPNLMRQYRLQAQASLLSWIKTQTMKHKIAL